MPHQLRSDAQQSNDPAVWLGPNRLWELLLYRGSQAAPWATDCNKHADLIMYNNVPLACIYPSLGSANLCLILGAPAFKGASLPSMLRRALHSSSSMVHSSSRMVNSAGGAVLRVAKMKLSFPLDAPGGEATLEPVWVSVEVIFTCTICHALRLRVTCEGRLARIASSSLSRCLSRFSLAVRQRSE